jgi:hypothetical protein
MTARSIVRITSQLVLAACTVKTAWAVDPNGGNDLRARKAELAPLCPGLLALKAPLSPQQSYQKTLCLLYGIDAPEPMPKTVKVPDAPVQVKGDDPFADPLADGVPLPPGYHCHFYGLGKKVCHGSGMD